ncbi:cytochrome b N-terminal domain-containing protein [Desulfosporosinus sp. Sb-LF]|uniref:cytochrome b N-terminal domain-containing protein n=1 Tax=Desulfosporosinus sp. Sb-LF TaxID=2560027 RepID=UPI00107F342A|nr:cytochrome b N-terminal domain-containing protein [Desulfosporosinus sp. Sb-LF]TGE32109.1 cytochrome bc complex cytochrome b subunit [Desulfosporosinus sp. Sb-LF]
MKDKITITSEDIVTESISEQVTERYKKNFVNHIRPRFVPDGVLSVLYTFCLGGLSFLAFIVLGVTGLLLMFHYQPGESTGFNSILTLASVIPYGGVIRNLHYWAGQLMVVTVNLHMLRVVWTHSYKSPRQLNWLVGVGLLILILVLDFTGYLLIGSQESGAAATVAVNILGLIPGFGVALGQISLGEPSSLSGSTLVVYVWHCVGLPMIALILQFYHFWRIRRDGGVRPL